MNQPPEVTRPINANAPVVLPILSDPTLVTVVANDPQQERLTFIWNIPRATSDPDVNDFLNESGDWISTLKLPTEWVRDGDKLEVTISDQAQPRNIVIVEWIAEVPQ